ncbi:vWA domain-containing protein [Sphingomonas sp. ERG5]|uniref:vWA domain-containing protein n=1 Tax=Sphingomonas sp. ERG5 TaxID=1381597 RepID=UPI00054B1DFE|nr:vWA domain-containing protein [Sphingomonas sp. ERG5]
MPNPTITPWAPGGSFTVTGSTFAAADIALTDIANAPASLTLTLPANATLVALRDPASWTAAATTLLNPGAWVAGPILVDGQWTVTIMPSGAATDPVTVQIEDQDGSNPNGTLRLIARALTGNAIFEPAGGTLSIDRVLADPSITNPQVTSGLPVEELANVSLGATVSRTESKNGAAVLTAPPPIVSVWTPEPANPAAVSNFSSPGTTATFKAPAAYTPLNLSFRITGAYNIDGGGLGSASNPRNSAALPVAVQTVTHGMLLVLDRSGSMDASFGGGQSRWTAATRAAHAWLDLFRAFRPAGAHKAGILTFEHDGCGWKAAAAVGDITLRNPENAATAASMSPLTPFGDVAELVLGTPQTCTPIGDALVAGFEAIDAGLNAGSETKRASVLLLTDGYENSGKVTIAASIGEAAQTFAQKRLGLGANDLIGDRLFTLAVGQQVDADRLNQLGTGFYQMASEYKQMLPAFAEMLGKVLDAQPVMPVGGIADPDAPPNALYFPMSAGEQKIAFLVPWSSQNDTIAIAWRAQGSAAAFTAVNPAGAGVKSYRRKGHGVIVADIPAVTGGTGATQWRMQHFSGNAPQPMTNDSVLCMADLMLKAEVAFDRRQYFIGDPITLSCGLVHGGAPVSGSSVLLDVARPGEGLGTFLATHAGRYKAVLRDLPSDISKSPDQYKGKALMHAVVLRLMQLDHLPDVTPPAPGLAEGAPGQYAATFADTAKEGTYTFRWRVDGTLPDGSRFTRVLVRSTWVGVRPDPSLLGTIWQTVPGGWTMTFTPKTASGELLGPFRADTIDMTVAHGSFDGDLVDHLDGSYSRKVLSQNDRQPVVSIDIYGTPMNPTGPGLDDPNGFAGLSCWLIWCAAWRCLIRRILALFGIKP